MWFPPKIAAVEHSGNINETRIRTNCCRMHKLVRDYAPPPADIIVFTDGACIHNGKPGARGAYAAVWPNYMHLNFGLLLPPTEKQTNNRAELRAVLAAIERTDQVIDPNRARPIVVHTDSMLIVNTVTKWMPGWKKNGWRKGRTGEAVANVDLLKILDLWLSYRKIAFRFVRAHTGRQDYDSTYNNIVDQIARSTLRGKK